MKLSINSKEFLKAVQLVGAIVKTPHTMPILDNLLFVIENEKMMIVADNLEMRSQVEVAVSCTGSLSICLPYKLLSNILKGFANEPIELEFKEKIVVIKSATGTYNVPPVPAKEFPNNKKEPGETSIEVNSWEFVRALKKATFFTDKGGSDLENIDNVVIKIDESGTKIASTDKRVIFEYSLEATGKPEELMVSGTTAMHLIQSITNDEQIKLFHSGNHLVIKLENREISSILRQGTFPNYQKVFDNIKSDKMLRIDRDVILPAMNRLYNITDQSNHTLVFSLKDNLLELSFQHDLQKFDAVEKLTCDYTGEALKIGFNAKYLKNILTAIEDDVVMDLSTSSMPCKLVAENIRALLSPIKLN